MPHPDEAEEIVWQGRLVTAKRRGKWEYVSRSRNIRAVVILAIDADDHVLLVEQFRVPLGRNCIELPAGLVGDHADSADEAIESAAARELEEETGYRAARIKVIGEFCSSPGMVSETFTLIRATELTRVSDGGGVDGEDIAVHRVPVARIAAFVAERRAMGDAIDVRLLLLLAASILRGT